MDVRERSENRADRRVTSRAEFLKGMPLAPMTELMRRFLTFGRRKTKSWEPLSTAFLVLHVFASSSCCTEFSGFLRLPSIGAATQGASFPYSAGCLCSPFQLSGRCVTLSSSYR